MSDLPEQVARRRQKLELLRSRGIDPYPPRFRCTHTTQEAASLFQRTEAEAGPGARTDPITVAGRITTLRGMGRASFLDLRDGTGRLQVHLRRDLLGDGQYQLLKLLDLGDFLGARGSLFRTKMGEITLEAQAITVLGKALLPLPEKWHGLQDVEKRYRQRYLDLIANEETRRIFLLRSRLIAALRRFLDERGFVEVETPILVPVAAGALARPFITHHHALGRDLYLRIATELYLKRLVVGGIDRVYELGRVFRNEGIDQDHNPEFTLLEAYQAYADYRDIMRLVEELVATLAQEVLGTLQVPWGEETVDLTPPWRRAPLLAEIHRCSGIDLEQHPDADSLARRMKQVGLEVEQRASRGRLIDKLIAATVEPHLVQPTFLVDYPVEMSPLAKEKRDDPRLVERFEGFAGRMELANAFTELNDPLEQRQRMEAQERLRRLSPEEELDRLDEDFLLALEHGMPPTGGLGMGIDRLVMLFTNQSSIREAVLFPQLRT